MRGLQGSWKASTVNCLPTSCLRSISIYFYARLRSFQSVDIDYHIVKDGRAAALWFHASACRLALLILGNRHACVVVVICDDAFGLNALQMRDLHPFESRTVEKMAWMWLWSISRLVVVCGESRRSLVSGESGFHASEVASPSLDCDFPVHMYSLYHIL